MTERIVAQDYTAEEIVALFCHWLTAEESREIIEFELDGIDTLGLTIATLIEKNLVIDAILRQVGAYWL